MPYFQRALFWAIFWTPHSQICFQWESRKCTRQCCFSETGHFLRLEQNSTEKYLLKTTSVLMKYDAISSTGLWTTALVMVQWPFQIGLHPIALPPSITKHICVFLPWLRHPEPEDHGLQESRLGCSWKLQNLEVCLDLFRVMLRT